MWTDHQGQWHKSKTMFHLHCVRSHTDWHVTNCQSQSTSLRHGRLLQYCMQFSDIQCISSPQKPCVYHYEAAHPHVYFWKRLRAPWKDIVSERPLHSVLIKCCDELACCHINSESAPKPAAGVLPNQTPPLLTVFVLPWPLQTQGGREGQSWFVQIAAWSEAGQWRFTCLW